MAFAISLAVVAFGVVWGIGIDNAHGLSEGWRNAQQGLVFCCVVFSLPVTLISLFRLLLGREDWADWRDFGDDEDMPTVYVAVFFFVLLGGWALLSLLT